MSFNLEHINQERLRRGQRRLTQAEAERAHRDHPSSSDSGFDATSFLVGLAATELLSSSSPDTGTSYTPDPTPAPDFSGGGGSDGGGGASSSW